MYQVRRDEEKIKRRAKALGLPGHEQVVVNERTGAVTPVADLCWGLFEGLFRSFFCSFFELLFCPVLGGQKAAQEELLGGILGAKVSQVGSKTAS